MKREVVTAFTRAMGRAPTVADARDVHEIAAVSSDQAVDPVLHLYWMLKREREGMERGLAELRKICADVEAAAARDVPLSAELSVRFERIEERVGQTPTARMLEPLLVRNPSPEPSLAAPARDLTVFAIAVLACIAVVMIATEPGLRSPLIIIAAFAFGVCASMGWMWLEPIVSSVIERRRGARR